MSELQHPLPYKELGELAGRALIRELADGKQGRTTYFLPFNKIRIREGFNIRTVYNGIEELADSIEATGLVTPLTVDITADGKIYVEKGHRRFRALLTLQQRGTLKKIDNLGIKEGKVECFVNPKETTELDRIKGMITSNELSPLTDEEKGAVAIRLRDIYNMSNNEISRLLGVSRQTVDNWVFLHNAPPVIKEAIAKGVTKFTAALELARSGKPENEIASFIKEAEQNETTIGVKEAKAFAAGEQVRASSPTQNDVNQSKFADVDIDSMDNDEEDEETDSYPVGDGEPANISNDSMPAIRLPYDDSQEMRPTEKRITPPREPKEKDALENIKLETTMCTEVIQMVDKINVICEKGLNEQAAKDVDIMIRAIQQRMTSIKYFVQNAEIRD
jgi:ParB-like chromosome segregation protein Spo0J